MAFARTLRSFTAAFGLLLGLPTSSVSASTCEIEPRPAATLLLPYFEVDLADPNGVDTHVSVHNASSRSDLVAKVEIWSDFGVPVGGFNVYLPRNGAVALDLRQVLNCSLPSGAPPPTSPYAASCAGAIPLPAATCAAFDWKKSLTGLASTYLGGKCASAPLGDSIARGFVTIDTMNACTSQYQGQPGFFTPGGGGSASNANQLWGDFALVDPGDAIAFADTLVHIEADAADARTSLPGNPTFYGKFVGWTAADNREPLPAAMRGRFVNSNLFDDGTDLLVWHDSKVVSGGFNCGATPAGFPFGQTSAMFFAMTGALSADLSAGQPFPRMTQRVHVGSSALPVPTAQGWVHLNFNYLQPASAGSPPADPRLDQGWLVTSAARRGSFTAGAAGIQTSSGCAQ
jgi:hypothetical protein